MHDVLSLAATAAGILAIAALIAGKGVAAAACALAALAATLAARSASQQQPGPMPYALRWVLYMPRWPLTVSRLRAILEPRPSERILEIGPGVGIYSLPIAAALVPGGTLEALDVQPEMLGDLERRAHRQGVANIATTAGDVQRLPYADASLDAAYAICVLGEVPDPDAALRELRRVLAPHGRLIIGEALLIDPDGIRLAQLRAAANRTGFDFERRLGPGIAYFARFHPRPAC